LVYETDRYPQLEYTFRHALTQETVYNAILLKQRRKYHLRAGEALEAQSQAVCENDQACAMLAHHFDQAGDRRALHYYRMAGDHAFRLYAIREAIDAYTRAIELTIRDTDSETLQHLYLRRGRAFELASANQKAQENYIAMKDLALSRDDDRMLLAALMAHAALISTPSDVANFELSQELCSQALELARKLDDKASQARILWILQLSNDRYGNWDQAVRYGEQALELSNQLEEREVIAYVLNDLGQTYYHVGNYKNGRQRVEEAVETWISLDNKAMQADALSTLVFSYYLAGEFEKAIRAADEALSISTSIGNLWGQSYSRMYIGRVYFDLGEPGKAIEVMIECLRLSKEAGFVAPDLITQSDLARVYAELGAFDQALTWAENAIRVMQGWPAFWRQFALSGKVLAYTLAGDLDRARPLTQELMALRDVIALGSDSDLLILSALTEFALADRNYTVALAEIERFDGFQQESIQAIIPQVALGRARALAGLGRMDESYAQLQDAYAQADALGQRWTLWQAFAGLSEIEIGRGEAEKAARHREQAAALIAYIADHTGSPELRKSFLKRQDVQHVLTPTF
jgi:tetratricopeptide (TPR) repeat protein